MTNAIVVGSGPNGLACAAVLTRAGIEVTVLEAEPTIGGGARSEELTVPGVLHDVCSAVQPMADGRWYPELDDAVLVNVTEMHPPAAIDRLAAVLG